MTAYEWLKQELQKAYGNKAEVIGRAIRNNSPIQFSSPEKEAEFKAILREWNRREDEEEDEEISEHLAEDEADFPSVLERQEALRKIHRQWAERRKEYKNYHDPAQW